MRDQRQDIPYSLSPLIAHTRSQAKREQTPGGPDITKDENLLTALLSANRGLVDVFKCSNDLEATANAEQEKGGYKRGQADVKPEDLLD